MDKICKECGLEMGYSQFAKRKLEGEPAKKMEEDLACRNFPACEKAEVECKMEK